MKITIYNFIGALIFLAIGVFIGIIACVEFGIYDAYTSNLIESHSGKRYYTSAECEVLLAENKIHISSDTISNTSETNENNKHMKDEMKEGAEKLRAKLAEHIE